MANIEQSKEQQTQSGKSVGVGILVFVLGTIALVLILKFLLG